jgi:hypothetical protein
MFCFAKNQDIYVQQALLVEEAELFRLPLSMEVHNEFLEFQLLRNSLDLQENNDF